MNSTGKILSLNPGDPFFNLLKELDQTDFPRPWNDENWANMNWAHHLLFAWLKGEELIGFALFAFVPGDNASHLLKICLKKSYRGQGLSQFYWSDMIEVLKLRGISSIFLEVESTNHQAIGFYRKNHFKQLRSIKAFYSNGGDAETMLLTL